jgi:hypothetical protein
MFMAPSRRLHTLNPTNFKPASGPSSKWSAASAIFPGGLEAVFAVMNRIVRMSALCFQVRVHRALFATRQGRERGKSASRCRRSLKPFVEGVTGAFQTGAIRDRARR